MLKRYRDDIQVLFTKANEVSIGQESINGDVSQSSSQEGFNIKFVMGKYWPETPERR